MKPFEIVGASRRRRGEAFKHGDQLSQIGFDEQPGLAGHTNGLLLDAGLLSSGVLEHHQGGEGHERNDDGGHQSDKMETCRVSRPDDGLRTSSALTSHHDKFWVTNNVKRFREVPQTVEE
jgi:hypothetical protein